MNDSYAHFLFLPFYHFSLFALSFYLKDMIVTYLWLHEAFHTGLKAMMMTEPTPLLLKKFCS
jgi:hypothetical protein